MAKKYGQSDIMYDEAPMTTKERRALQKAMTPEVRRMRNKYEASKRGEAIKSFFSKLKGKTIPEQKKAKRMKEADVEAGLEKIKAPKIEESKPETKSVPQSTVSSFGQEFKRARMEGVDSFMFGGKSFSTATAEDVKASGSTSLREYLNKRLGYDSGEDE
jgi:hypothetical protein